MNMSMSPEQAIDPEIENIVTLGKKYAEALLYLDPTLAHDSPNTPALGLEVGSGPDIVAFERLGFNEATITNGQSAGYGYALQTSAMTERSVLDKILENYSPPHTTVSNLDIGDFLDIDLSPRLITMLGMAPYWFKDGNPAKYMNSIISLRKILSPNGKVVLSAKNDKDSSTKAFEEAAKLLGCQGINHQLYIDDGVPQELQPLGQRILIFGK